MVYSTYFIIRQILMSLLFFMGGHMLLIKLPESLKSSFYQHSLRVMGVAFLIVPLSCILYSQQTKLDLESNFGPAINLTSYFAAFVLISTAFLILLGARFNAKARLGILAAIAAYPIPLWLGIKSGNQHLIDSLLTASYSLFIIIILIIVCLILYRLKKVARNIENFYSDDIQICVRWISKSVKLLIGLSLTCIFAPIFFIYPHWLRFIFMSYGVFCYFYIYYGYRRMLINLAEKFLLQNQDLSQFVKIEQSTPTQPSLSYEHTQSIEQNLSEWVELRGYARKGITINDVAKEINTNRTYLSRYINSVYNCSFRSWVSQQRLVEAKRLLSLETNLPMSAIADAIGSASVESFTHIFARLEGMPPSAWRKENLKS